MIGSLGDLIFETSAEKMLSFPSLSHALSANIETHTVAGSSPIAVFIGPGEEKVSFDITLSAGWGVNPLAEAEKLRRMCRNGTRHPLIIGSRSVGEAGSKWMVSEVSEERLVTDNGGRLIESQLSITLQLSPDYPKAPTTSGSISKSNVQRRRIA